MPIQAAVFTRLSRSGADQLQTLNRQRILTLPTVVSFLLSGIQGAVQSELDQFFAHLRNRADSVRVVTPKGRVDVVMTSLCEDGGMQWACHRDGEEKTSGLRVAGEGRQAIFSPW